MLTYNEFKESLLKEIKKFLGKEEKLSIGTIWKNNEEKAEVLTMKKEGTLIAPAIHLDNLYGLYRRDKDMDKCVSMVLEAVATEFQQEVEYSDWEEVVQNVVPHLINLEWNRNRIEKLNLVYREFQEFAIIFSLPVKNSGTENCFYDICHEMLEEFGHTPEELYPYAMDNLKHQNVRVINMEQLVGKSPLEEDKTETVGGDLYIVSNESLKHGANVLLLEDFLLEFANAQHSDFIIFPSSVHEVMLYFNHAGNSADELRKMVREINEYSVLPEERLSNEVYCFKRETGKVELMK